MSPSQRVAIRPAQRWSKPEQLPASLRGRAHWVVRWIGAAKRRSPKLIEVVTGPGARIIQLSWADTFGRPVRIAPARLF